MSDLIRGFIELVKNGVIHRDLKPANILIHNGIYKLAGSWIINIFLDFGFAKYVENFSRQLL